MKRFIRHGLLNSFTLYLSGLIYPGLLVPDALDRLLIAGFVFTLLNRLVKPIIKLFLLPLNLITLGLFRWLANVLVLVVMTRISSDLQVVGFNIPATSTAGFATPSLDISPLVSYILASMVLSLIFSLLNRFMVKE